MDSMITWSLGGFWSLRQMMIAKGMWVKCRGIQSIVNTETDDT